jgi:uncharacterized protein RhaS with RHS repeats
MIAQPLARVVTAVPSRMRDAFTLPRGSTRQFSDGGGLIAWRDYLVAVRPLDIGALFAAN